MIKLKDLLKEKVNTGTKLYHGTSSKYAQTIFKNGLQPKPNKWMVKYVSGEERAQALKELPKELFVSTNINHARDFAKAASEYGGTPIVLQFMSNSTDTIETDPGMTDSYIMQNKVTPDRIKIIEPSDFDLSKVQANIQKSREKTDKIKQINTILKKYNKKIKSGSKTTDRVLGYVDDYVAMSILLSDLKLLLQGDTPKKASEYEKNEFTEFIKGISDSDIKSIIQTI